jgi:ferredoxin/coenzyme F420-reducing hydrogenase delta subunit
MSTAISRLDEAIGAGLDHVFAPTANPWRHLGSLAFLFLVVCAASGVYLYALFDTSLAGAYDSGRALDRDPLGRLVRGLHRYSADAFAVFTALHLVREAARSHFRAHRAWSWLSGLVLVPLAWAAGITGFWLAWDERALFSASATAEWLAAWPWQVALFARNFVTPEAMNDRFFSLVVFMHIGVPLIALAACWAHFQRLSHVRAWPPAALGVPATGILAILALVHPAVSAARADALAVPASLAVDWFYFFPHTLATALTPAGLWIALAAGAALLAALPYAGRRTRPAAAVVDLANCNGCARCAADCPFGAVVMVARSDARPHAREASVVPDLCAACGICAGACPSSTPFRHRVPLASGIDLPRQPVAALREQLDRALAAGGGSTIVFACSPANVGRGAIVVECAAMVPPAFVQYALRRGARGVVVAACREGDCEHRLGDRWTLERFAGRRAPALRAHVPRDRVRVVFCGSDREQLERAIEEIGR